MTIWIEKYNRELENHINDIIEDLSEDSEFNKQTRLVRYYSGVYPEFFKDYKVCSYFNCLMPKEKLQAYFSDWGSFQLNQPTYVCKKIAHRVIFFDDINKQYFHNNNSVVLELEENGKRTKYLTHYNYAKDLKDKQELFYDKMKSKYTNYEFDYPAFSNTYKGSPRFWKLPEKQEVYGIELELRFKSYPHKLDFAQSIKNSMRPWICEKDGSLDDGSPEGPSLELIGPPLSLDELKGSVDNIGELLTEHKASKPNNTYALHITTNINNAKNPILAGARFMAIINDEKYRDFWTKAAGRPDSYNPNTGKSYAQWLKVGKNIQDLMSPSFWNPRWAQKPIDHYYATFLRKGGTSIETRIFKSSITPSLIKNRISLIAYLWRFAKSNESMDNWIDYISCQNKFLTSYLKKNQMIPA